MVRPPPPPRPPGRFAGRCLAGWVAAVLAGCASPPATHRAEWTPNRRVAVVVAPYWSAFPPFAEGLDVIPSRTLGRGTPVRQLRNRYGFSEIQLETLERGWVPRGLLER